MIEYQELMAEHQALQKQLADQPDAVEIERVLRLITQARDAGVYIDHPEQRERLRAILKHWAAFVYERTGEFPATQLAPYEVTEESAMAECPEEKEVRATQLAPRESDRAHEDRISIAGIGETRDTRRSEWIHKWAERFSTEGLNEGNSA